ncbi:hypothetical protein BESB_012730 [Besnoitia besnoiti]|uniref:RRM domain-containing protein n=1 Tax=Besnoitia besnoiti TaxID=94643 RepID=A0A2A9M8M6_BESBE|nr:hypothetical protein BESB_012730 [Besnoitia besnoiti]PFH32661.1 hypothetical protein BESB_012730 [Besnoitia besnoiti]
MELPAGSQPPQEGSEEAMGEEEEDFDLYEGIDAADHLLVSSSPASLPSLSSSHPAAPASSSGGLLAEEGDICADLSGSKEGKSQEEDLVVLADELDLSSSSACPGALPVSPSGATNALGRGGFLETRLRGKRKKFAEKTGLTKIEVPLFLGPPPALPDLVADAAGATTNSVVLLSHLSLWQTDVSIREAAVQFGRVRAVRILNSALDGRSAGVALLQFVAADDAERSITKGLDQALQAKQQGPRQAKVTRLPSNLVAELDACPLSWTRGGPIPEALLERLFKLAGLPMPPRDSSSLSSSFFASYFSSHTDLSGAAPGRGDPPPRVLGSRAPEMRPQKTETRREKPRQTPSAPPAAYSILLSFLLAHALRAFRFPWLDPKVLQVIQESVERRRARRSRSDYSSSSGDESSSGCEDDEASATAEEERRRQQGGKSLPGSGALQSRNADPAAGASPRAAGADVSPGSSLPELPSSQFSPSCPARPLSQVHVPNPPPLPASPLSPPPLASSVSPSFSSSFSSFVPPPPPPPPAPGMGALQPPPPPPPADVSPALASNSHGASPSLSTPLHAAGGQGSFAPSGGGTNAAGGGLHSSSSYGASSSYASSYPPAGVAAPPPPSIVVLAPPPTAPQQQAKPAAACGAFSAPYAAPSGSSFPSYSYGEESSAPAGRGTGGVTLLRPAPRAAPRVGLVREEDSNIYAAGMSRADEGTGAAGAHRVHGSHADGASAAFPSGSASASSFQGAGYGSAAPFGSSSHSYAPPHSQTAYGHAAEGGERYLWGGQGQNLGGSADEAEPRGEKTGPYSFAASLQRPAAAAAPASQTPAPRPQAAAAKVKRQRQF